MPKWLQFVTLLLGRCDISFRQNGFSLCFAGDGKLSDTEIDYGNENSGDEEIDADESDNDAVDSDDDVRVARPRKQKFKNLDEVMDESKYDSFPAQIPESHTWAPSRNDPESKDTSS